MKTILITGGNGFLGRHLAMKLSRNYNLIILEREQILSSMKIVNTQNVKYYNTSNLEMIFFENEISCIIHTATCYGRNNESAYEIISTNILLPIQLAELAIVYKCKLFINTDTFYSKQEHNCGFLKEYTLTKKQINDWLLILSDKIKVVNMRLQHIYGPNDSPNKYISQILSSLLKNEDLFLSPGEQLLDFVYIEDVSEAFSTILKYSDIISTPFTTFDIATGVLIRFKDFLEILKNAVNSKSNLYFGALPYRQGEVMNSESDIRLIMKLGWRPKFSVETGILKMIKNSKLIANS